MESIDSYIEVGTYDVSPRFSRSKGDKRTPEDMNTTVSLYVAMVVTQVKYFTFVSQDLTVGVHDNN